MQLLISAQVLFMVISHSLIWSLAILNETGLATYNLIFPILNNFSFLSFFQLTIPVTAGFVLRYQLREHIDHHRLLNFPLRRLWFGVSMLAISESVINVLAYGWISIWEWDVLKLLATSFVLITLASRWHLLYVAIIGGVAIALTPKLRQILDPSMLLGQILIGDDGKTVFWPIFPWLGLGCFGFCLLHLFFAAPKRIFYWVTLTSGFLSLAAYHILCKPMSLNPQNLWGEVFAPNPAFLFGLLGFYLLLFCLCQFIGAKINPSPRGFIRCFSRGILAIYAGHLIIGQRMLPILQAGITTVWLRTFVLLFVLLASSWLLAYLTVRWIADKRYTINIRSTQFVSRKLSQ